MTEQELRARFMEWMVAERGAGALTDRQCCELGAMFSAALAAATGTAKTAKPVECGASQSGTPKEGNAHE